MDNLKKLLLSYYVIFCAGGVLIWMNQNSLEAFWQQSYHAPPPWQPLQMIEAWQAGSRVHKATASAAHVFWLEMSGQSDTAAPADNVVRDKDDCARSAEQHQPVDVSTEQSAAKQEMTQNVPADVSTEQSAAKQEMTQNVPADVSSQSVVAFKRGVEARAGQRILFAGDSMMQGVAPHVAARLRREYGLSSLDLSRQSTGLAYPGAFNWPATISGALEKNPDIRLLVLFLGPNDPWDMPPKKGWKYLRFASADWEVLYRSRIRDIIHSAKSRSVQIIWVSPPNMRSKDLSSKVGYLAKLYESEVLAAGEVFLSANQVFKYPDGVYSDYSGDGSQKQKMRASDGVHFSRAGQQALADALFDLIVFAQQQKDGHDSSGKNN